MAFPTTGVLETFTGSNGTSPPNSNWSNGIDGGSGIEIQGNQADTAHVTNSYGGGWWNAAQFGPDVEAFVSVASKSEENDQIGLAIRVQSPGNAGTWDGYVINWDSKLAATDEISVWVITNGSGTQLGATIMQEMAAGDKLGVEMIGNSLKVYRYNGGTWTLLATRTDSTYTGAGFIGLNLRNANATGGNMRADDFGGGTVVTLTLDSCLPDADLATTGWTATPLFSKVNDASDATIITATAS